MQVFHGWRQVYSELMYVRDWFCKRHVKRHRCIGWYLLAFSVDGGMWRVDNIGHTNGCLSMGVGDAQLSIPWDMLDLIIQENFQIILHISWGKCFMENLKKQFPVLAEKCRVHLYCARSYSRYCWRWHSTARTWSHAQVDVNQVCVFPIIK